MTYFLTRFFKLTEFDTTISRELSAGFTTFLTMAYILFANPSILSGAGMDPASSFLATCLVSAIGSALIGLIANYPIALAPGMALTVYFSYTIVQHLGYSWQSALGAVFISGVLFLILTLTQIRRTILEALPKQLCIAVSSGIGIFIGVVALKNMGIVVFHSNAFATLGPVLSAQNALFLLGFVLIMLFERLHYRGSIALSILIVSLLSLALKLSTFHGVIALPALHDTAWFAFDLKSLCNHQGITFILTFLMVALFDSTGTLVSLLHGSELSKHPAHTHNISRALVTESLATIAASLLGTSSTSPYVESIAGIKAGGRTGLTAVTVSLLFLTAIFFSPLARTIPTNAVSAGILFIAYLMTKNIKHIDWKGHPSDTLPCVITLIMIPLTFSIAYGFGIGLLSYVILKILMRRTHELNAILLLLAVIFGGYFFCWLLGAL